MARFALPLLVSVVRHEIFSINAMLRILGGISIFGNLAAVQQLSSMASIPGGLILQVGAARSAPEGGTWCYRSEWFGFRLDSLDEEIVKYLDAHARLGPALESVREMDVKHAMFTLTPIGQNEEEIFSCMLGVKTLSMLANLGLALEVAPASVMPDAPYWIC